MYEFLILLIDLIFSKDAIKGDKCIMWADFRFFFMGRSELDVKTFVEVSGMFVFHCV
jgi:hypothetical protein